MTEQAGTNTAAAADSYSRNMARIRNQATERARKRRRRGLSWLALALALAAVVVAGELIVGPKLGFKLVAAGFLIVAIGHYTNFLWVYRVPVRCPHCGGSFDLNRDWECGWCGDSKQSWIMQTVMTSGLLTEPCNACGDVASAFKCPECEEPIVFDVERFNQEEQHGHLHPGVARLI